MIRAISLLCFLSLTGPVLAAPVSPETLLAAHNRERAALSLPPLAWSIDLAAGAQAWADRIAESGNFNHSSGNYGENLWGGTANAYSQTQMVQSWADEKAYFKEGTFPDVTTGGVVGHYTQIIWRNTTEVGCGLATGDGMDYLVCRYNPAGNYLGQKPY